MPATVLASLLPMLQLVGDQRAVVGRNEQDPLPAARVQRQRVLEQELRQSQRGTKLQAAHVKYLGQVWEPTRVLLEQPALKQEL